MLIIRFESSLKIFMVFATKIQFFSQKTNKWQKNVIKYLIFYMKTSPHSQ